MVVATTRDKKRRVQLTSRWMGDVSAKEDDGLPEDGRPRGGHQNRVDAAQLHVDLQAEVGEGLWRCLVHILRLHALRRQSEHDVTDAFHLGCTQEGKGRGVIRAMECAASLTESSSVPPNNASLLRPTLVPSLDSMIPPTRCTSSVQQTKMRG